MDLFWIIFLFLMGACVGSFLNVVIYRVPRGQSIAFPGSHCPICGRAICWYDNIPLLSWMLLRAKCRFCKAPISPRYIIIEAITAILVVGLYLCYFVLKLRTDLRWGLPIGEGPLDFFQAWPMFIAHAALLCGLLVCSAVDVELWIVPLEVCWVVSLVGVISAAAAPHPFMAAVSAPTVAISLAAIVGLAIAMILMHLGFITPSFLDAADTVLELPAPKKAAGKSADAKGAKDKPAKPRPAPIAVAATAANGVKPRREVLREVLFLTPAIVLAIAAHLLLSRVPAAGDAWAKLFDPQLHPSLAPALAGAGAAIFGYLIGGLWIWGTRIFGTLAFNKEAMGMGDVHILAAVGAVTGWIIPSIAFFVAPILGLLWAIYLFIRRDQRELPYGPWLAAAALVVLIFYDEFATILEGFANAGAMLK